MYYRRSQYMYIKNSLSSNPIMLISLACYSSHMTSAVMKIIKLRIEFITKQFTFKHVLLIYHIVKGAIV